MRQIAEKGAAVRVVTHVLNDGAAVGERLRPAQVFFRRLRIFFQKQRLDVTVPGGIDDGFMRKHGVGLHPFGARQREHEQASTKNLTCGAVFHFP